MEFMDDIINVFKNSILFIIGIKSCLFILQTVVVCNYELSMKFGGLSYIKDVILQPGIIESSLLAIGIGMICCIEYIFFFVVVVIAIYLIYRKA